MEFQKVSPEDLNWIQGFQPEGWPDIAVYYRMYLNYSFCHPVKIMKQGEPAGIGCAIHLGGTGWLGHIIVSPRFQRQGIGTSIVDYLCTYLKQSRAVTISLNSTLAGYPVYRRYGFQDQSSYLFYESDTPLNTGPDERIRQLKADDSRLVFNLDRRVSGEFRALILKDHLHNAQGYFCGNQLEGVYLPDLGEGLIIAETQEAGLALMRMRHGVHRQGVVPVENQAAAEFYQKHGFKLVKKASRMVLGQPFHWQPEKIYGRIGGYLG
jgi:ribosomal protein S18 acetylase RimI-like enzyme